MMEGGEHRNRAGRRAPVAPGQRRFPPGTLLAADRYRIVRHLGGGMEGEVYEAEDLLLGEPVALKFLSQKIEDDPVLRESLFHEVQIARRIDHPNVCRIHDAGTAAGRPFVSMVLYDRTLAAFLVQNRNRLEAQTARELSSELCQGLAAIHAQDILHCDLKPGNVMVDHLGRARIADFGLARHAASLAGLRLAGTPLYMAPELFAGDPASTSVQSDLYALGLVLYEMFTGRSTFQADRDLTWKDWAALHRSEPTSPSELVRDLDPAIERVILSCLAKDPARRPASAKSVAAVLEGRRPDDELLAISEALPDEEILGSWMGSVEADHETLLPFFEHHADVLLEQVYVELQLEPRNLGRAEVSSERLGMFAGLPLSLRDVLEFQPAKYPWVTRRWLLRGDPGAGKTTLLRHFAARLASEGGEPWVPLFESLPRWLRDRGALLERADARLVDSGHPQGALRGVLERLAGEGRLLLLLDGLDEVSRESRAVADGLLRDLARQWPRTPIVVASRSIGVERPHRDFVELELLPFDAVRRRAFLARWFGRVASEPAWRRARELVATLEADPTLRELGGNPLYLTLMALLYEEGKTPECHRTRLYDDVFKLLYEGRHWRERKALPNRKAAHQALCCLAHSLTEDNRDAAPVEDLEARLCEPEAAPLRQRLAIEEGWRRPRVFLEDVANRTGILGPHDGPGADWRFWHRTFREALAAEQLEQELHRGGEGAILAHARRIGGDESRWAEPYALLAGRVGVGKADAMVRALVKENRPLGLRAVATAQGLSDDTLREVLELTEKWQERREVYARIPKLIGEPERALALVNQLRGRTRDGNDLFFLEQVAEAISRKWPQAERLVAALCNRFYAHIPAPPEDLFRSVETPYGGREELWREIPAGEFQMGSAGGGLSGWEGPRHKVIFKAPSYIAAVPVTNAQYAAFDPDHQPVRWGPEDELSHHPVVNVTWYQAAAFCRWLSTALPGARSIRLPSEAEWEHASRAGTETRYWSGDEQGDLARVGWYDANSGDRAHRVGEKPANPWGLYDMHGNVLEWCRDTWNAEAYKGRDAQREPVADPLVEAGGASNRVVRGGSWLNPAGVLSAAFRHGREASARLPNLGFRCVFPAGPVSIGNDPSPKPARGQCRIRKQSDPT